MKVFSTWLSPLVLLLTSCTPRIEVAAPKEPLTINMNVKIEHDIQIKADPQVDALLKQQQNRAPKPMQPPK